MFISFKFTLPLNLLDDNLVLMDIYVITRL